MWDALNQLETALKCNSQSNNYVLALQQVHDSNKMDIELTVYTPDEGAAQLNRTGSVLHRADIRQSGVPETQQEGKEHKKECTNTKTSAELPSNVELLLGIRCVRAPWRDNKTNNN